MATSKTRPSDLEKLFEKVVHEHLTLREVAQALGISTQAVSRLYELYLSNKAEFSESDSNKKLSAQLQKRSETRSKKTSEKLFKSQIELPFRKPLKADDICQAMIELGNTYYEQNNEVPKSPLYLRKFMTSAKSSGWEVIDKPDGRKSCIKIEGQVITYDAFNKRFKKYLDDSGR